MAFVIIEVVVRVVFVKIEISDRRFPDGKATDTRKNPHVTYVGLRVDTQVN
jgi:hypothetical protein